MGNKRYAYIGGGSFTCALAVALAYLTTWLQLNRQVFHTGAAFIAIVGLFLIWYGLHQGYYERMLRNVKAQIEDTDNHDV